MENPIQKALSPDTYSYILSLNQLGGSGVVFSLVDARQISELGKNELLYSPTYE